MVFQSSSEVSEGNPVSVLIKDANEGADEVSPVLPVVVLSTAGVDGVAEVVVVLAVVLEVVVEVVHDVVGFTKDAALEVSGAS